MQHPPSPADLTLAQARILLEAKLSGRAGGPVDMALDQAAGTSLAEALYAPGDLPPFDNSAMDGYALNTADLRGDPPYRLPLDGTTLAGEAPPPLTPGHARRITTGAALPLQANTVIIQEWVQRDGEEIQFERSVAAGNCIRAAGIDVGQGDLLLPLSTRLGALQLALAANVGVARLKVRPRPTVAVLSTGSELVEPGRTRSPGKIYDSNRYLLAELAEQLGGDVVYANTCGDDRSALIRALESATSVADIVVTSGGVSVGDADLLPGLIAQLGEVYFHKLALKPGRPVLFGELNQTPILALPGNPVSVLVTCLQLLAPALDHLSGALVRQPLRMSAQLDGKVSKAHSRLEFQRGRINQSASGKLWVSPVAGQGSHQLAALRDADCFLVLPEGPQSYAHGDSVFVEPLIQYFR